MEIQNFRLIQLLVADSNLSRAAERLHLTQSALSKRVAAIEQEMGFSLFERRGPRGLRALPQALELARLSERVGMAWETGVRRIRRSQTEPEHFVLVGPQLFLREVVLPWWAKNEKTFPTLQLEVQVSSLDRVSVETLETGADAAILENREELPDHICKPIYTERWGIVRHTDLKEPDMNRYIWGTYSTRRNPVDIWLVQRQRIAPPKYRFYWQDLTALAIWVADTPGAASVLPWHTVAWLHKRKRITFEPLGAEATTRLFLAYPKDTAHKKLLKAMTGMAALVDENGE
ncbi:LysR family transcriptional regulator [Bdellovibrionota bacterium FG-1]